MRAVLCAFFMCLGAIPVRAETVLTLVTTTSTEHSGLMGVLLPAYEQETGIVVRAVVAATGKALRIAEAGDADILIAHDKTAEQALVESGTAKFRKPLMHNGFIIVGPANDPAMISAAPSIGQALHQIATHKVLFTSRGDDSGTHRKEVALWDSANIQPGEWRLETGAGQGATLNYAAARGAYALTDRGTWLFFANKGDMKVLFQGDPALLNEYGISLINPARHPHVNETAALAFIDWMTGPRGQALIADYRIDGEQAFFPSANKAN